MVLKRRLATFIFAFAAMSFVMATFPDAAFAKARDNSTSVAKKSQSYKSKKNRYHKNRASYKDRFAALVVDADSGQVLYEKNAGNIRYPASLTKMMTLYLTFEALENGKLSSDTLLPVSAKAANQPQTNIDLSAGDQLPVEKAIQSVVVRSANDSAMVLAEAIGGTEWNFALMMTKKARELGMKNTVFRNPNGLPDNKQRTTAYDMARLAIALRRDFPSYYPVFKLQNFTYNGVEYPGHNRVLERYPGADGVKTGYIRASGFNLVTSVKKDGYNLVAVVMGGRSAGSRDDQMVGLLDRTFAQLEDKDKKLANNNIVTKKNNLFAAGSDATLVAYRAF